MKSVYSKYLEKYMIVSFALFISAFSYNVLVKPINLVAGGTNGVAVIVNSLFNVDSSITIFVIYFSLMIVSFIFLGFEDSVAALFITIIYPMFIKFTSFLVPYFSIDVGSIFVITVFAGFLSGISNGLIYKTGLNTGGFGIISKILYVRKKIPIAKVSFIINFIIVLVGVYVFGFSVILYAVIYLYINKMVSEWLLIGISKNKLFYIFSDSYLKMVDILKNDFSHDVTIYDIMGKSSNKNKKMVMVVVPTSEYLIVKELIHNIDKNAFVFVSDSYETLHQDVSLRSVK